MALVLLHQHPTGADKTITVAEHGNNTKDCWSGQPNTSCLTLDFALGGLENNADIHILYSHNFSNTTFANVTGPLMNVTLSGTGQPTIFCSSLGDGIVFWGVENVSISGIRWEGCSHKGPSTAIIKGTAVPAYSGLFFYDVTNLLIRDCYFTSDGRGMGAAMYDVKGQVSVLNTHFVENTIAPDLQCADLENATHRCVPQGGGLYIELMKCGGFRTCDNISGIKGTLFLIERCTFENNSNSPLESSKTFANIPAGHWPFGLGGGVAVMINGNSRDNTVRICDSTFTNNYAVFGGGIQLQLHDLPQNNTIVLTNLTILKNSAVSSGGLRACIFTDSSTQTSKNHLNFNHIRMIGNFATWGGGALVDFGNTNPPAFDNGSEIAFTNCTWESNYAIRAGAAIMTLYLQVLESIPLTTIYFNNCTFDSNQITPFPGATSRYGQGSIYTLAAPLHFTGKTTITNSLGGAFLASACQVHFSGNVAFTNNQGFLGSGIYLSDISEIVLHKGLNLTFSHNDAFDSGGAMYYTYPISRAFNITSHCFMMYEDFTKPPSQWDVSVTFLNNTAQNEGNAIYIGDATGCYWPNGEFLFDMNMHPLNFTGNLKHKPVIGTPADNIMYLSKLNITDGFYTLEVIPGQTLDIPVRIYDYFNSSTAVATLDIKCFNFSDFIRNDLYIDICRDSEDIVFTGPRLFVANGSITGFSVGGRENTTDLIMVFRTMEAEPLVSALRIFFTECPYGFYFDDRTKSCKCYDDNFAVRCFTFNDTQAPCILDGYWFGKIMVDGQPHFADKACYIDHCITECTEPCQGLQGWCKLPDHAYELCANNHDGPLCSFCRDGFSPAYDWLYCIPNSECGPEKSALLFFLIIVFWALIVIALLVVLKLNLRIGSGYMYCLVYYFSVLPYITGIVLQNHAFRGFISLFISISALDPQFLAYIKICFIQHISPIQNELLRYFHPLLVALFIYLIVVMNRYCPRMSILHSPIHALCILLLLSYTSLFRTSLTILLPISFTHGNPPTSVTFVYIQPDTTYFDPQHHLPYAIIALLVEFGLVIPFTLVMLLAPWLMRWGRMVRVKPILDEFQACYKDNYRWFAGYYFVARHVVALPNFIFTSQSTNLFCQQILSGSILLIHAYIQPYKERWLNLLDTILLLDLTLLSMLNGNTSALQDNYSFYLILKFILLTIPCIYFIITCIMLLVVTVGSYCRSRRPQIKRVHPFREPSFDSGLATPKEVTQTSYTPSLDDSREHRHTNKSSSCEDQPLLPNESLDHSQAKEKLGTSRASSKAFRAWNRVTSGVTSQMKYWRATTPDHENKTDHSDCPDDSLKLFERS